MSARRLRDALEGRRFTKAERHGKWLLARTDGGPTLVLHFGMTSLLVCGHPDEPAGPHGRVLFTVGDGRQLRSRRRSGSAAARGAWCPVKRRGMSPLCACGNARAG